MRRSPIKPQSVKRRGEAKARRSVVEAVMSAAGGRCARCGQAATEAHEPQKRSRNPKAWLDPALCVPSCRACNSWAEEAPAAATAEGWLIPSWVSYEAAVAAVAALCRRAA